MTDLVHTHKLTKEEMDDKEELEDLLATYLDKFDDRCVYFPSSDIDVETGEGSLDFLCPAGIVEVTLDKSNNQIVTKVKR